MTNKDLNLTVAETKAAATQLEGLSRVLLTLDGRLRRILVGMSLGRYMAEAVVSTGKLGREIGLLQAALLRLQQTVGNALLPIAQAVLPILRQAVNWVTETLRYLGRLTVTLFGAAKGQESFAQATQQAAKTASRSLAAFDQLNRLQGSTDPTGTTGGTSEDRQPQPITPNLQEFIFLENMRQIIDAMKALDFEKVILALQGIWQALLPLGQQLCAGLHWAFWNVFYPMSQWAVETVLPLVLEGIRLTFVALSEAIETCRPGLREIWHNILKPMGQWAADKLVEGLTWLNEKLMLLGFWLEYNEIPTEALLIAAGAALAVLLLINAAMAVFNSRTTTGTGMVQLLTAALNALSAPTQMITAAMELLNTGILTLCNSWNTVRRESSAAITHLRGEWQGLTSWFQTGVLAQLRDAFRNTVNGIIGFFNTMLQGITGGINSLINRLNTVSFTVPDWVPEVGGSSFGISLNTVRAPQIPLLAKGAVLPANRPFMAVVGDQRHGTNVEAPLATIQQAVALVLEDMAAGQAAGQEAVVGVLRQILEAVLGISIGDGDIARAVERYNSRRAVVNGSL